MHDFESKGSALRAAGAIVLTLAAGAAWAQAAAPADAAAAADQRRVNVNEYIVRGNTVLEARDIEKAVYPYLGPDRTLSDIEAAREALQTIYQERGYQSVYVDLPEQQVADGIVFLQVSETKVGRVRVVGAKHYSPLTIRDEVPALQEGEVPNFNRAQAELTNLNRGASRQVVPLVKEGRMPGTMDVDLKVEDKSPWHASVGLNNDYSADTKKLRSTASIGYDNLWQLGHSVSLTFFTAPQQTDNAKVWSGSYSMPLSNRWSLQFSGYKSDSNVATIGGTNVLGKGHSFGVSATYSMEPQGEWYNSLTMGIDYKKFDETTRFGNNEELIPLKYLPFTFSYNGYRYSESSPAAWACRSSAPRARPSASAAAGRNSTINAIAPAPASRCCAATAPTRTTCSATGRPARRLPDFVRRPGVQRAVLRRRRHQRARLPGRRAHRR